MIPRRTLKAASLALSGPTVTGYVDLLVDLLLVRRLRPLHANVRKRLVKSPKVYVRDSGLVHALLGIDSHDTLAGHPVAGASWEGFVIENLLAAAPPGTTASFYRTRAGAEIDLVMELPGGRATWAVEIKLGLAPSIGRGFHYACEDVAPERAFIVCSGDDRYPLSNDVEVIGLREMAGLLGRVERASPHPLQPSRLQWGRRPGRIFPDRHECRESATAGAGKPAFESGGEAHV